ncbi:MAG: glycoside hydrolase family 3 C-terminal domain-containing protein [Lachnospiraceae bacterium]|nr:glycoside hydrolase family 3 C-terminal domain-containing protein [Lachnospiraceae bacterium]
MSDYRNTPLWNNKLPIEERLTYLVNELTLEEKISCLTTSCPDVERLGIKATSMGGEAAHGIEARHDQAFNRGEPEPTTSFTQPIGMSGSFDRELIRKCGQAVGEEARALFARNLRGGLCRWAPTIDMERDPRWGRTEEAYGEDPYLTGEMASAYIQGMRGDHPFYIRCGATLKHFYANNVEQDRIRTSSSVDERNKYEYYLEPFRKAVEEGGAEAIMTSYNEINGVPAILNHEVQDIVKDTWGLPGHVVCDGSDFSQTVNDHKYFKTHGETLAYGLKAGVDCFTDSGELVHAAAKEALENGWITEEDIDRSVRNSFRTRIRLGFFDGEGECPYTGMGEEYVNSREHQEISREMAQEAVVLLKNEGGILPLHTEKLSSLAVVGPLADEWYKDWYCGIPPYHVTVLEGIKGALGDTEISYHSSLSEVRVKCGDAYVGLDDEGRLKLVEKEKAETFIFTDWGCGCTTLLSKSRNLYVTLEDETNIIRASKKEVFDWFVRELWDFKVVGKNEETESADAVPVEAGRYSLESWNDKTVTVDQDGYLAVMQDGISSEKVSLEKTGEDSSCKNAAEFDLEVIEDGIDEAVKMAATAERAVVVIGSNPVVNSKEEIDRTTLALPPAQQKLVDSVLKVNPNTVAVLVTNYPYSICKINDTVPAIVYSASGSQELGNGIAAALTGEVNPAGRLPMTWYRSEKDLPDINDYDIIKGKRTYQYFDGEVLYPFGYGLSYTEFAYSAIKADAGAEGVKIKLSVTNTGKMAGDEVVQLYVHKESSRVKQPIRQLKGFQRLKDIAPGETRETEFYVSYEDMRYYDVISRSLVFEDGNYTFMAGASSQDIRQQVLVRLNNPSAKKPAENRDPFGKTLAIQYDDYDNCFIHRGTKGHTMEGHTCILPGKPGDAPDTVSQGRQRATEKISGLMKYRDFLFDRIPERMSLRICAVEDGAIELSCTGQAEGTMCKITVGKSDDLEFTEMEKELPEGFLPEVGSYELQIRLHGKIKIAEFCFQ